jgi:hypothetical protein
MATSFDSVESTDSETVSTFPITFLPDGESQEQEPDMEADLRTMASEMCSPGSGLEIKNRKYLLTTYSNCFIGSQALDWIMRHKRCPRSEALSQGNELIKSGYIRHVADLEKPLLDGYFFYCFTVGFRLQQLQVKAQNSLTRAFFLHRAKPKRRKPNFDPVRIYPQLPKILQFSCGILQQASL